MKRLLGEEYGEYLESFSKAPHTAYRVNTGKVTLEQWRTAAEQSLAEGRDDSSLFSGGRVPWCDNGFYYDGGSFSPAKHPYYFAGLFYMQEPSAMIPAAILPVEAGDMVLDLCAAPGGKATELGGKLMGTGFLVANDVSASRTMALTKNLQMAGIANVLVTAETPERLAEAYPEAFDKILVDAPCSGEGMFRREPRMIKDWLDKGPEAYAPLQQEILEQAYRMLKPGGKMVYSTCTFSLQEDEEAVNRMLCHHPDMQLCPVEPRNGYSPGRGDLLKNPAASMEDCVRIYPHRASGEGHFAVLLQKGTALGEGRRSQESQERLRGSELLDRDRGLEKRLGQAWQDTRDFLENIFLPDGVLSFEKETLFWHSHQEPGHRGLRVMYGGMPVCRWKHKVQPSPQLALTLTEKDYNQVLSFSKEDGQVIRYLKGETLQAESSLKGDVLVCVDGWGLGWCQGTGQGTFKNKYYPGWRYR